MTRKPPFEGPVVLFINNNSELFDDQAVGRADGVVLLSVGNSVGQQESTPTNAQTNHC